MDLNEGNRPSQLDRFLFPVFGYTCAIYSIIQEKKTSKLCYIFNNKVYRFAELN